MNFVFLGPPGAGKGTAAQKLSVAKSIPHISTGDLFRAAIAARTDAGEQIRAIVNRGDLVPDELTIRLVRERLSNEDARLGIILDGFPRTLEQAKSLEDFVRLDAVLLFSLADSEILRRLSGRRVCGSCARVFHVEDIPPRTPDVCDACGSALIQRDDDRVESIEKRLAVFRLQTLPVVRYYEERALLSRVDSSGGPHETYAQVTEQLRDFL